jgi:5-enolpyruvylshikimate-3-phosphate synthase
MAMSMLALPEFPVILDQTEVVGKSYPGFWEQWQQLGYRLHDLN